MDDFGAQLREALQLTWAWLQREWTRTWVWWRHHSIRAWRGLRPGLIRAGRAIRAASKHSAAAVASAWGRFRRGRREAGARRQAELDAAIIATGDDDVASITGQVEVATQLEVVLIVPRGARPLRDPAVWPHLAAHARRRGVDLLVVSPRRDVRSHAADNGLRAATSIKRVRRSSHYRFGIGGRSFRVPRIQWGRWVRATLLVVGVSAIAVVACYAVPSAEIVIVPVSTEITATATVRLDPLIDEPDLDGRVMPARRHTLNNVVTILSTTTSGTTEIGEEYATVEVSFTNGTTTDRIVPRGLQLINDDDILFATDEELDVPANTVATVAATAVFPGTPGNIEAGTLTARDPLPRGMSATNPLAGSGGTNVVVAAVASEDVDRIRAIRDEVLLRVGQREMADEIGETATYFPETLTSAVFSELPLANPGDPGDVFLMEYTAVISALVLDASTAAEFGALLLQASLPPGQALLPGSTDVFVAADTRRSGGQLVIELTAVGRAAPIIDPTDLEGELTGATTASASAMISSAIALEAPPEIRLLPEFIPWRWLPRRADRISIRLAGPASLLEAEDEPADGTATATATPTSDVTDGSDVSDETDPDDEAVNADGESG